MFTDADDEKAPRVVIVNEAAARARWGAEDPVGKRIFNNGETWITIVGVVSNVKQYGLEKEATEEIYSPVAQAPFDRSRKPGAQWESRSEYVTRYIR